MFNIAEDKIGNSKPLKSHKGRLGLVELRLSEPGPGLEEISDEGRFLLVQHSHGRALLTHFLRQHPRGIQIMTLYDRYDPELFSPVLILQPTDLSLKISGMFVVV